MKRGQKQTAFTIVELLIVIVVIGILAALVISTYSGVQARARDAKRTDDVSKIVKALQLWSVDTGKTFQQMNSGNTMPVDGWYDSNYGGGSVQDALITGKYLTSGVNDPLRDPSTGNRHRYMLAPCTSSASDTRRVVMAELERPPSQSVAQQLSGSGCNSGIIASYESNYFMNYGVMANSG